MRNSALLLSAFVTLATVPVVGAQPSDAGAAEGPHETSGRQTDRERNDTRANRDPLDRLLGLLDHSRTCGDDVRDNLAEYLDACERREWSACGALVACHNGEPAHVQEDAWNKVGRVLQTGCEQGAGEACYFLGLYQGTSTPEAKAADLSPLLERACSLGYAMACLQLGEAQGDSDHAVALAFFEKACTLSRPKSGEALGCLEAARLKRAEIGGAAGATAALRLYERACDGSVVEGCIRAAKVLAVDRKTTADHVRAVKYLKRACALRPADDACVALAFVLRTGSVEEHPVSRPARAQGTAVVVKACDAGHPQACVFAGRWTADASAGHQAQHGYFARGVEIWNGKCLKGDGGSCAQLARIYSEGTLVRRDAAICKWYADRARELGNEASCP